MSKGKIKAVLFFVLFFLVVALVIALMLELQNERELSTRPSPAPAVSVPTAIPTAVPLPPAASTPAPVSTPAPTPEPVPAPEPVPVPEPTPEPLIPDREIGSGQFVSDTGVELNLRAVWTAYTLDEEHIRVCVDVYLDSYSLQITAARSSVQVSVGEDYRLGDSPTVDNEENVKISTLLCSTEHIVSLRSGENKAIPVQVIYNFGGVYMKKELPTIECGGYIGVSF